MMRPVPMQRVLLLAPRTDLAALIDAVGSLGAVHLLDLPDQESWRGAVARPEAPDARRALLDRLRRIDALLRFHAPPPPEGPLPALPDVDRAVDEWSAEVDALRERRVQLRERAERLERVQRGLASLAPSGVDPARLGALRFLHAACGWIDERELPRLEESLARIVHGVTRLERRGARRLVLVVSLARDREALQRALRGVGFERLALPSDGDVSPEEAEVPLAERVDTAREQLAGLEAQLAARRDELAAPLAAARAASERELLRVEAAALVGSSACVAFLSGWVPRARVAALRSAADRATAGRFHLRVEDPRSIDAVRRGAEEVPILFRNPAFLRPFEALVAAFGRPRWGELDPTALVAVSFWTMFGLMFGDVGHGAVLAALGGWMLRRMPARRDLALALVQCGISSALFGFAFGSVFGREDWIPALWFRPMEDVGRLLRIGAAFGLVLLSLGFALGVVNALLRRAWREAVLGPHGALAAAVYWTAAALGLRWLASGEAGLEAGRLALVLGAPLALFWACSLASELREPAAGRIEALFQSAIHVIELLVRSIANTVSFVRLAAFAVSHAGLLVAVFSLAQTVSTTAGGSVLGVLVIVIGNVAVVALEGLIVSIQAVRLVYYEFFSKFYEGLGLEYRPLRLAPLGAKEEAT